MTTELFADPASLKGPTPVAASPLFAASSGDVPSSSLTTATVAVGGSYSGRLERGGDADWIKVTLVAGETYRITLAGTGSSAGLDTVLRIYDPASTSRSTGTVVATNDDANNAAGDLSSAVTFTATQSGTYYIDARAYDATVTGNYQVTVGTGAASGNTQFWTLPQIADYLTATYWGGTIQKFNVPVGGTLTVDLQALDTGYQAFARAALQTWTDVTGLHFTEVTSGAQITFTETANDGAWSSSTQAGGYTVSALVNVQPNWAGDAYTLQTFIHEIGHALGLGHAGPYNGSATFGVDNIYANDSWQATVMSYFDQIDNTFVDASYAYLLTPMLVDVIAIRALYGNAGTTRTGDSTYGYNSNLGGNFTQATLDSLSALDYALAIVDDGGIDTIDLSGSTASNRIDLRPGTVSNTGGLIGNLSIALGTIIENARGGSGRDTLIGNDAANVLTGGNGNDVLDGGNGGDTAVYAGNLADWVITGDVLSLTISRSGETDTLANVEYLRFDDQTFTVSLPPPDTTAPAVVTFAPADGATAVNPAGNIVITFSEAIARGTGLITIRAGSATGPVTEQFDAATSSRINISGSALTIDPTSTLAGTSSYVVTIDSGAVADLAGNGYSGTNTYDFTTDISGNLIVGTANADTLTGTAAIDILRGLGDNDILTGGGAIDVLDGGDGADIYIVATAADHGAAEFADTGTSGIDEVRFTSTTSGATLTLYAGDTGIERAVIGTGTATTAVTSGTTPLNINAAALTSGITLIGNARANTLTGGSGDDTLRGGAGSDTLIGGAGFDYADYSTATSTITANLSLTTAQDTGGAGSDTLGSIEGLIGGTTSDRLVGNALDNILWGNAGSDTLNGGDGFDQLRGGTGKDTLTGGAGADWFVFDTTPASSSNRDTVADFVSGTDTLQFSQAIFAGLATAPLGALAADAFWSGAGVTAAHDATDRFIYNTTTGLLYYDADGTGAAAATVVALLGASSHPALIYSDLGIIA